MNEENETQQAEGKASPSLACSAPPSWFAAQGAPACSMWGKTEIEYCAWAYVKTLELLGDKWGPTLTVKKIRKTLKKTGMRTDGLLGCLLRMEEDHRFWECVRGLDSPDAAFEVGGLAWTRRRFDMQND